MNVEANKALIRRYIDAVWSTGDLNFAHEVLADTFVDDTAPPGTAADRAGHHQNVTAFRAAFPDAQFRLQDLIAEGDKVVVRWTMQAHHQGSFFGLPPTGKPCTLDGIDIYQVADGKIVAAWHRENLLGLLRQINPENTF